MQITHPGALTWLQLCFPDQNRPPLPRREEMDPAPVYLKGIRVRCAKALYPWGSAVPGHGSTQSNRSHCCSPQLAGGRAPLVLLLVLTAHFLQM